MTTGRVTYRSTSSSPGGLGHGHFRRPAHGRDPERPIRAALVDLFDRYQAASWLMVAALLDETSARSHPGSTSCWYAPDVIERIVRAKVRHEIGSHGGRHIYFDRISAAQAQDDLAFAKGVHHAHGLGFESFVYPRGSVGHLDVLAHNGIRVVRSRDVGLLRTANPEGRLAARAANFIDQFLPVPPRPSWPHPGPLIDIQDACRCWTKRIAPFRLPSRAPSSGSAGCAKRTGGTFHLCSIRPTSTIAAASSWRRSAGSGAPR